MSRASKITAEIIADSINTYGDRLTTFIVTVPRIVLAEFNTHRMFSRNSASSRAIPFETMLDKVMTEPFIPIKWQKDHKGMQGTEYLTGRDVELADGRWLAARNAAVEQAKLLNRNIGVTKQFCNRLLEPFLYHTIIVTSSEWENFFALRAHEAAEIHIQNLAFKMLDCYNESTPKQLKAGEWHIPFGDKIDEERVLALIESPNKVGKQVETLKVKIATARCARVSYLNYEGGDDYEKDIILHDRLSSMGHWSPFEHCARAMDEVTYNENYNVTNLPHWFGGDDKNYVTNGVSGNFKGFIQYRKTFKGENKIDFRVAKLKE
ncbi:MAG: FAD-dependent thymidylate synthase [Sphaerochaetaceae bacterium]|nr:FAD-dependent thymidylate synthase [Sphaerochaetaceae bacterium]